MSTLALSPYDLLNILYVKFDNSMEDLAFINIAKSLFKPLLRKKPLCVYSAAPDESSIFKAMYRNDISFAFIDLRFPTRSTVFLSEQTADHIIDAGSRYCRRYAFISSNTTLSDLDNILSLYKFIQYESNSVLHLNETQKYLRREYRIFDTAPIHF